MRIGDASRARRFANPARLRWYAFHRSVRFALRMMRRDQDIPPWPGFAQMPSSGSSSEGIQGAELVERAANVVEGLPN